MKITVHTLFKQGYNKTQIANMLKIDRKTVRKILKEDDSLTTCDSNETHPNETPTSSWPSLLDPYKEFIEIQVNKGLTITRIHQDLVREFDIQCGYSTLRDYVSKIRKSSSKVYMVLTTLPGEEAQVDFGYIGTLNVNGKAKKAWIFVMVLSYSRYMYVEITFDQSVKTFIRCHTNAFRYFNGVPETIKIDNLKAGIVEADFYEPIVQRNYAAFAEHYGFLPNPCRVYTPTDKGKVESNVKYVKDNCFKGRSFKNYEEAQNFLSKWLDDIANKRKHGTTGKIPEKVFEGIESKKLKKLPTDIFIFSKSKSATVWTDCHISYEGNYYSVPHPYIGVDVNVIECNNILKIYYQDKEIALHPLAGNMKGEHITDKSHYPSSKTISHEQLLIKYLSKMEQIGEHAVEFFSRYKKDGSHLTNFHRGISGVIALQKKYDNDTINRACERACHYNNVNYKTVKKICETGLESLPLEVIRLDIDVEQNTKIRELSEYKTMLALGVIGNE